MKERKEKKDLQQLKERSVCHTEGTRVPQYYYKKMLKITSLPLISSMGKHTPMFPYIIILKPN